MIERTETGLYVGGVAAAELAERFGTPLLVMDEDVVLGKVGELKQQFLDRYENVRAAYAGKAFLPMAMCKVLEKAGLCLDVVSGGELYTALEAGFPPERIEMNGNNKSVEEIQMAVAAGVGRIIIDGPDEAALISQVCKSQGKTVKAMLRISPGVDSHTHQFISTGNVDSKFGIPLHGGVLNRVFGEIIKMPEIELLGFHYHIGSQLHENDGYLKATGVILELMRQFREAYGFETKEINLGGGFGVRYTQEDDAKPYSYFLDPVMAQIQEGCLRMAMERPCVVIEPGRSLVANAGATLYRVGTVKEIPGIRKYVSVDGGMTDNIRTAMYDSKYECADNGAGPLEEVTICGKCCESGDILIHDANVWGVTRGDLLAVDGTGAYCLPMASNYNKIPHLAVVMTKGGTARLVVRRQTLEELVERERVGL